MTVEGVFFLLVITFFACVVVAVGYLAWEWYQFRKCDQLLDDLEQSWRERPE